MTPSEKIDTQISETQDWRGDIMFQFRKLVASSAPELKEDWKWSGWCLGL